MGLVAFVSMSLAPFAVPDYFLNARRFAFAWNPCVLWVRVNAVVDASAAVPVGRGRVTGSWLDGLTREVSSFFFKDVFKD